MRSLLIAVEEGGHLGDTLQTRGSLFFGEFCTGRMALPLTFSSWIDSLLSQEGVRQGDVLGSALFALSMTPVYGRGVPNHPEVVRTAILDDLYLVGPPQQTLDAFDILEAEIQDSGLEINCSKSMVLLPSAISGEEGIPALGAMVGRNEQFQREWLLGETKRSHTSLFESLRHVDMPTQHCFTFLRLHAAEDELLDESLSSFCRGSGGQVVRRNNQGDSAIQATAFLH